MRFPGSLKKVNHAAAVLAGVLILVMGILSTLEGIARGLFNRPTTWSLDVCRYLLIWAIFLGSAFAFQEKSHVAVDFIREGIGRHLGNRVQRVCTVTGYGFALIYAGVMAYSSVDMLLYAVKWDTLTRGIIQIPIIWLYLAMLAGSVAMITAIVFIIIGLISGEDEYI